MLRAKRQECSASYLQHPKITHLVDIQSLYTSTAFKIMYIRFISSGQVSQHPDALEDTDWTTLTLVGSGKTENETNYFLFSFYVDGNLIGSQEIANATKFL